MPMLLSLLSLSCARYANMERDEMRNVDKFLAIIKQCGNNVKMRTKEERKTAGNLIDEARHQCEIFYLRNFPILSTSNEHKKEEIVCMCEIE